MTMKELNQQIAEKLTGAKERTGFDYKKIANACNIGPSTLANKKAQKELPTLSFWTVAVIAKLAGYQITFTEERSSQ